MKTIPIGNEVNVMLYEKIKADLKDAMKNKDVDRRNVLKLVVDKARTIMKEKNPNEVSESIPDDVIISAIEKEIKQMNQTLDSIPNSSNSDCQNYLKIRSSISHKITLLSGYLPKKLTEEEIREKVTEILAHGDYKDIGQKMKACMSELKGKADGSVIRRIVMTIQ